MIKKIEKEESSASYSVIIDDVVKENIIVEKIDEEASIKPSVKDDVIIETVSEDLISKEPASQPILKSTEKLAPKAISVRQFRKIMI